MARARAAAGAGLAAAVAWLLVGTGPLNYDTLYALVWGRDLAHGHAPDYSVPLVPTPHPLANLAGIVLTPLSEASSHAVHGGAATTVVLVGAFLCLGVLTWLVYALGAAWFDPWAGALAAAIVLTRRPVLDFGARAYVDMPYLVLVLAALLVETRRPRAGAPVLVLLALAGLIRPEAWLFSLVYVAYLAVAGGVRERARLAPLVALALAGPALWALSDLVISGSPLHSLTKTQATAQTLDRITGLQNVPGTAPRRIGEILREPVLFGAAGGGIMALLWLRRRALLGAVAGVVAFAAFCLLAASGLPILGRYLLLPSLILAIFCGAGAFGWRLLPRDHPRRRLWAWFGVATIVALIAFIPPQVTRIRAERHALSRQASIERDLRRLVREPGALIGPQCLPVIAPNHRPVPLLALWLDTRPQNVLSAQERLPPFGEYVLPANRGVAHDYILDPRDLNKRIPPPPHGFYRAGADRSWVVFRRCRQDVVQNGGE
jgi:hypothetical protein